MAEIKIERKKKPVWPWILVIVLLAIIGWVAYEYFANGNQIGALAPAAAHGLTALATALPIPCFSATV